MPEPSSDLQHPAQQEATLSKGLPEYENLFTLRKEAVLRTLRAASQTPNGAIYNGKIKDGSITFDNFLKLPNTTPEQLSADVMNFRVPGESAGGYTVQTSGSSGIKKEIRFSKQGLVGRIEPYKIEQINSSRHPILLIDKDSVDSTSHTVLKRSFEALATKQVETEGFTYPNEALDAILKGDSDLIYIYLNPTLANLLLDGLMKLKEAGDPRIAQLMGRKFFLESGGDEMTIEQIKDWDKKLTELFGDSKERIMVFYGQSEQLLVGRYDYKPGDTEIKYKVSPRKLCLVLDKDGKPVIGEKGRLEVTHLLDASESIEGITVLPRYLTGDLAVLSVENGEYYLTNVERDPERAIFSVMGEKIFLNMLPAQLDKLGLGDVRLEFQELVSGDQKALRIVVIPKTDQPNQDPNVYVGKVGGILLKEYPSLAIPIRTGNLKIRVELGAGSFEKRWRFLGKTEISPEKYDEIESNVIPISADSK